MALEVNISKSQSEMDDQFVREYIEAVGPGGNLDEFLVDWGMSENDVIDYLESNPQLLPEGFEPHYEGAVPEDGDDRTDEEIEMGDPDSYNDFIPDYSKTAEYEGEGITSEFIPGEGLIAPALAGLGLDPTTAAMVGAVATKKPGMLTNKLFAGKKLKANQKANRGTEGPVVTGTSRTAKGTGLRPAIKQKTADRYKSMSDRVKGKRVGEAATVAGAGTAMYLAGDTPDDEKVQSRNLKGNRDKDGNLITASDDDYDYYGNRRAVTKMMNDPDGFLQRQMRKKSTTGTTQRFTQDDTGRIVVDDEIGFEEPTGPDMPETMGNQFGYHKQEGQNFWTVNNDDAYWDTHEMGTGDAWSDADLKEVVQELDWSSWFK